MGSRSSPNRLTVSPQPPPPDRPGRHQNLAIARSDVASRTSRTSAASFEKPFSRPAEERPADFRYDFSCSPGYISFGGRCFAIPKGAVDFELSQADMFMLPPGAKGHITVIDGGLF